VALLAFAPIVAAVAAEDWMRLDEELWSIRDKAGSESPSASAQALIQWLHETPTASIEKSLDLSRSNVETGIFEVIAAISSRGDHTDALGALEELDARVATSDWHEDFVAIKAKLHLRLRHVDEALTLAREASDTVCPTNCDGGIKQWLAKGTLPPVRTTWSPKGTWLFDERGSACESNWATDKLDEFDAIDLIEASAGVRVAAQSQLVAMWRSVVAGCVQAVDRQRLERLLTLGWTKSELAVGYASALKPVEAGSPNRINLLGATLALPDQECDFAADATCKSVFKPISKDTAVRIVERLQPLHTSWASQAPAMVDPEAPEERQEVESRNQLSDQYDHEMDEAAVLDATNGLARMRKVLADTRYKHLGASLNSYSFGQGLGRWSREGRATDALQIFRIASDVGGPDFNTDPRSLTATALLQLRSGEPKLALASLEKSYAMRPDEGTAKTIGKLRAGIGGANMLQQYPAPAITRPWRYSAGWPICDFFSITGGLERIEDVDLMAAFHGERDAALWQLAQEWRSVVNHCFDEDVWNEARARLRRVLGAEWFAREVVSAEKSLELGSSPHFVFAGEQLPLPDSEVPMGSGGQAPVRITRQRLRQVIGETHLFEGCRRRPFEHCN
jgi:hypothetical protein